MHARLHEWQIPMGLKPWSAFATEAGDRPSTHACDATSATEFETVAKSIREGRSPV